ncbi:nickel/cobalt transporter [Thioalkalivibrio paradoxus]|uniref:Nickel/cobalt efflux system n=1 Tax=Thioalkalivibrio paradoxus ARh 1 TaxID=713585 RepID=W0DPP1_9GAMM|nr:nickel/cobalt transporter [Thioalkalivibrio paradoxus]AHE98830.1 nickel transporter [Thioalkalivibrio paradoxus ARh 1]
MRRCPDAPRSGHALPALIAAAWLLLFALMAPVPAASSPFASASPETPEQTAGALERMSAWVIQTQRDLHRQLTGMLHQLDEAPTARTAWALIVASFLYGIFHAAGPGHGKAVISTYLLTHPLTLLRGIGLSTAAALMQGVTAIVAVLVLIGVLGWLARDTMGQVRSLELASFLLVALLGLWLIGRALRAIWRLRREARSAAAGLPSGDAAPASASGDRAAPHFTRIATDDTGLPAVPRLAQAPSAPAHRHHPGCGCGTPHHVDPTQRGPWYATVLAVGIRPCSGAVLVMAVSYMLGIWAAGIAAVLAMSLGTAITVSALAILAVQARGWARRLLRPTRLSGLRYAGPGIGLAGGAVIFFVGWTLFQGTLAIEPVRHPLGL